MTTTTARTSAASLVAHCLRRHSTVPPSSLPISSAVFPRCAIRTSSSSIGGFLPRLRCTGDDDHCGGFLRTNLRLRRGRGWTGTTEVGAAGSNHDRIAGSASFSTAASRHCRTCTCGERRGGEMDVDDDNDLHSDMSDGKPFITYSSQLPVENDDPSNPGRNNGPCDLTVDRAAPLPPPIPEPRYSFHRRVVPSNLVTLSSKLGRSRFLDALSSGTAEAYFPLSEQFSNQSEPALCGPATLLVVLNALAVDPNVRWRGGWRWYGDESALLERCCIEEERVRRVGVTMDEFAGLARCQGAGIVSKRPREKMEGGGSYGIDEFRRDVIHAVRAPPRSRWDDECERDGDACNNGPSEPSSSHTSAPFFVVASFQRSSLGQTGDGHFSPIAAYHAPSDSCLVLDVARFKYPPYWATVDELYGAMVPEDEATELSRGWFLMHSSPAAASNVPSSTMVEMNGGGGIARARGKNGTETRRARTVDEREGKRPASCAPLAGSGVSLCPVEGIKMEYCPAGRGPRSESRPVNGTRHERRRRESEEQATLTG